MTQLTSLIIWIGIGFVAGAAVMYVALYMSPKRPQDRFGRIMRRALIKTLHGLTVAEAREVSAILMGGERIPADSVDRYAGTVYVGICACGCGQKVYYTGRGKRPKFVNRNHFEYNRGFRSSWE